MGRYSHWRTPKLEAELAAVLKLQQMPVRKGKAAASLAALENKRLHEIQIDIESVLKKRRR